MENPLFEGGGWADRWRPQFLSLLRIVTALLFLSHGLSKIAGIPMSSASFPQPWTLLWVAGMMELIGGLLLLLGLLSRPVALLLAGEMAVAYWMVHAPQNFWPVLNGGESAILFCFIFLFVVSPDQDRGASIAGGSANAKNLAPTVIMRAPTEALDSGVELLPLQSSLR